MGRSPQVAGGRPHSVCTRLSRAEYALVERLRGSYSRGEYLRALLLAEELRQQVARDARVVKAVADPYTLPPEGSV